MVVFDIMQNLPTGDQAQSVTSDIVTVADMIHGPKAPMWVDTPGMSRKLYHHHHHNHNHNQDYPKTISNLGWSDSEGLSDQKTFKDILLHLQKNKLTNVKVRDLALDLSMQKHLQQAVLWFITPTPRMDAILQKQAE